MGGLVQKGLICGWGMVTTTAAGLAHGRIQAGGRAGAPPCVMQNDYSAGELVSQYISKLVS